MQNSKTQKSSVDKVLIREKYLEENTARNFKLLNWSIPSSNPTIYSLYVLNDDELFNVVLDNPTNVKFISFVSLNAFIKTIKDKIH